MTLSVRLLAAVLAVAATFPALAHASVISVNISAGDASPPEDRLITGTFGVGLVEGIATDVANWNNPNATGTNLLWSDGTASSVSLATTRPNGGATLSIAYAGTPLRSGIDDYASTATPTSATLSNLQANFPSGYIAIVYIGGYNSMTGASISDGSSTFFYRVDPAPVAPVTFALTTQTTDSGAGANPIAQYAIFGSAEAPLTADSVTFTLNTIYAGGATLSGVQLLDASLAIPEASTVSLLAIAGLAALTLSRRRRA